MVKIVKGMNKVKREALANLTVGEIRNRVAAVLDVQPDDQAILNGENTTEDTVVVDGDKLEFVQVAGTKG